MMLKVEKDIIILILIATINYKWYITLT